MRIKDWPLAPYAEATLVAVGSPDACDRGRQWRVHAYFVDGRGELFDLRLPWGLLPKLRPGSVFVDGYLTGHSVSEDTRDLEIVGEPKLISWLEATRNEPGWMRSQALQDEYCLVFDQDCGSIIIPCVQVLRIFHAQTRTISHAVLRPAVLGELASGEILGDEAQLRIAPLVPRGSVTKTFARYLAKLVFEPPWFESFSDVFHRRFACAERGLMGKHDRIPLQCFPPRSARSKWCAVGRHLASGDFFISDVLGTLSNSRPPYKKLTIFHANSVLPPKSPAKSFTVRAEGSDGRGRSSRANSSRGPRSIRRPFLVRQRAIEHGDEGAARILDVYPGQKVRDSNSGENGGKPDVKPPSSPGPVSLDDERREAGDTSAEFASTQGRDTMPLHFDIFIKAFREVIERRPGWSLHFKIEALSIYVPNCQPQDRLVMFGRLKTPNTLAHLIELEPLEGQTSYTLAVTRHPDPQIATIREIGRRLSGWITHSGRSHVRELLKDDPNYQVTLSTHRDVGEPKWAARILEKMDPFDKRPAWTRGVAV